MSKSSLRTGVHEVEGREGVPIRAKGRGPAICIQGRQHCGKNDVEECSSSTTQRLVTISVSCLFGLLALEFLQQQKATMMTPVTKRVEAKAAMRILRSWRDRILLHLQRGPFCSGWFGIASVSMEVRSSRRLLAESSRVASSKVKDRSWEPFSSLSSWK